MNVTFVQETIPGKTRIVHPGEWALNLFASIWYSAPHPQGAKPGTDATSAAELWDKLQAATGFHYVIYLGELALEGAAAAAFVADLPPAKARIMVTLSKKLDLQLDLHDNARWPGYLVAAVRTQRAGNPVTLTLHVLRLAPTKA